MKLVIAITSFGNRTPDRYGPFYKMAVPGHNKPAHVWEKRVFDESTVQEFNERLAALSRDVRFTSHGVTCIAFADEPPPPRDEETPQKPAQQQPAADVTQPVEPPQSVKDTAEEDPDGGETGELPEDTPQETPPPPAADVTQPVAAKKGGRARKQQEQPLPAGT